MIGKHGAEENSTTTINRVFETDSYGYTRNFKTALPQIIAVSVKNLILLSFGTSLGFATILIPAVQIGGTDSLNLTPHQISWISSINLICVPLGCVFSGSLTAAIGRKRAMQLVNIPFIVAWAVFYVSNSAALLYVALAISGLTGGLLEAPVMIYVAEITQPHLRGTLSSTSSFCVIFGIFLQFLLGIFLNWRTIAMINGVIPVIAIIFLFCIPESPHWLLLKNREIEAGKSLQWLRGWTSSEAIVVELNDLKAKRKETTVKDLLPQTKMERVKNTLKMYFNRRFMIPYSIVSLGFFICHFSGMTTLQTYAVLIFETLQAPIDKYYATLILGVVQILGTIMCVCLIHITGKRPLVFFSTLGSAVCFLTVGCYAYYIEQKSGFLITSLPPKHLLNATGFTNCSLNATDDHSICPDDNPLVWIPLTFLISSALISHVGIRLLPWILIGEVYSPEIRSAASGFSAGTGYILGFVSNKVFLTMISTLTLPGTFWLYCSISFVSTLILYFVLPETEGYTLSDIELHFAGDKKLPNKVYRSKVYSDHGRSKESRMDISQINDSI